jgi:hypothetical protein
MHQQTRNKLRNVVAQCRKLLEEPQMNADEHRLTEAAMNALAYELQRTGFNVKQQEPITVYYDGIVVGDYFADLLVGDAIIVELKATKDTPRRLCRSVPELPEGHRIAAVPATQLRQTKCRNQTRPPPIRVHPYYKQFISSPQATKLCC